MKCEVPIKHWNEMATKHYGTLTKHWDEIATEQSDGMYQTLGGNSVQTLTQLGKQTHW